MSRMDPQQFKEMMAKLDLVIRLLTVSIVKDMKTQTERILALSSSGFGPTDIAKLLGTTANTVNVTLSKARKKTRTTQKTDQPVSNRPPKVRVHEGK